MASCLLEGVCTRGFSMIQGIGQDERGSHGFNSYRSPSYRPKADSLVGFGGGEIGSWLHWEKFLRKNLCHRRTSPEPIASLIQGRRWLLASEFVTIHEPSLFCGCWLARLPIMWHSSASPYRPHLHRHVSGLPNSCFYRPAIERGLQLPSVDWISPT